MPQKWILRCACDTSESLLEYLQSLTHFFDADTIELFVSCIVDLAQGIETCVLFEANEESMGLII